MPEPVRLPCRPAAPAFCPATQLRVARTMEAADEAELAGLHSLRDRLVAAARAEVAGVAFRIGAAA